MVPGGMPEHGRAGRLKAHPVPRGKCRTGPTGGRWCSTIAPPTMEVMNSTLDPPVNQGRDQESELLAGGRELFDVPEDVAYFNVANLAPHLHSVRRAGDEALDRRGRPWTIEPADWFSDVERLRSLFGRIIGTDAEGVALIPATSYGFAVAAAQPAHRRRRADRGPRRGVPLGHLHLAAARAQYRCGAGHGHQGSLAELDRGDPRLPGRANVDHQRAQRPLDRRRTHRARQGRCACARARRSARHRREPVRRSVAARRHCTEARLRHLRRLQVAARSVRSRLSVRRRATSRGPADRAELDLAR